MRAPVDKFCVVLIIVLFMIVYFFQLEEAIAWMPLPESIFTSAHELKTDIDKGKYI